MTYRFLDRHGFRASYEVITEASCQQGDAEQRGWLDWAGDIVDSADQSHWDLDDLKELQGYRWEGDGARVPSWVTAEADMGDVMSCRCPWRFLADVGAISDSEVIGGTISIHRPYWITDASWLRVLRILGWSWRY